MKDFISPIRLVGPFVKESEFSVKKNESTTSLDVTLNLATKEVELVHENNIYAYEMVLSTEARLLDSQDASKEYLRVYVTVEGAVTVPDTIGITEDELAVSLRLNAISMLYSFTRSYVEYLSSMSQAGRFTLPPIDPNAYVGICNTRNLDQP